MDFAPWFWTAKAIGLHCTQHEFYRHSKFGSGSERIDFALPGEARRIAHGAARHPGAIRLDFVGSNSMDGEEAGTPADQSIRNPEVLSDAPAGADGQIPDQGLPHVELRTGRRV